MEILVELLLNLGLAIRVDGVKQRLGKGGGTEGLQVVQTLADTDEFYRKLQLILYGEDNTAAGCAIQFRQDNTCDVGHFHEFLGLADGILSGGGIQHQEDFPVGVGELPVNDPVDLAKLVHESLFIVDSAGSVADDDVGVIFDSSINCVKYHGGRIRALVVLDDVHTGAVRPDLQLVDGGGTERVGGSEDDLFALGFEVGRHLSDGGGLADAVYADDEDHGRGRHKVDGLVLAEHIGHNFFNKTADFRRILDVLFFDAVLELADDGLRGDNTDIAHDEDFGELVIEVVANAVEGVEDVVDGSGKIVACLLGTKIQLAEKSFSFCHYVLLFLSLCPVPWPSPRSGAPGALRLPPPPW